MKNNFVFEADIAAKKIHISREFDAPIEKVWRAWTEPDLLEKWWSPKPHVAKTKVMDFTVGGTWQFAMVSPDGTKNWLCARFTGIEPGKAIATSAVFCDADGNITGGKSSWHRDTQFHTIDGNRTKVEIVITFEDEATIKTFAEGYFKQGTEISYNQLEELLADDQIKTKAS